MSVSNEVLLDVQGLEKAYGGNQVLNGITTQIRRGEVVAIIGPSGCGKSRSEWYSSSLIFFHIRQ